MVQFIIDGNNLIGKISRLFALQKKDGQASREQLAFLIDRYFADKKIKFTLHFDGYKNLPIRLTKGKIEYSDNRSADELIKEQIERIKNRKNITVVSSDHSVMQFAKVCSCNVISSEDFSAELQKEKDTNEEKKIIDLMKNDIEEFKKLFGEK